MYGYGARIFEPYEILEMVESIEDAEFDDIYGSEFYYAQPLAFKEKNDESPIIYNEKTNLIPVISVDVETTDGRYWITHNDFWIIDEALSLGTNVVYRTFDVEKFEDREVPLLIAEYLYKVDNYVEGEC